jgi:transcriptional regulator with XRE-family HTH domain
MADQGLTEVQLAEALDVSQQAITAYESGQRRVPISMLPLLARTLGVSLEELIGTPAQRGSGKRGPAPKLQQQLERIAQLPKARQRVVSEVLDSLLQAGR